MNFNFLDLFEFCSEILIDESSDYEYNKIDETQRNHTMFNLLLDDIGNNDFVVTFMKQDGEVRTMTGNLFGPDKGATLSSDDQATYLAGLLDNPLVKVYTQVGWRSFIKSNLITIELVEPASNWFEDEEGEYK